MLSDWLLAIPKDCLRRLNRRESDRELESPRVLREP
jgi:hypothetical protein